LDRPLHYSKQGILATTFHTQPGADPERVARGGEWRHLRCAPPQKIFRFLSSKKRVLVHSGTDKTYFWSAWRLDFLASSRLRGAWGGLVPPIDPPLHTATLNIFVLCLCNECSLDPSPTFHHLNSISVDRLSSQVEAVQASKYRNSTATQTTSRLKLCS